jgi:YesN/AraC family two-component response regulator
VRSFVVRVLSKLGYTVIATKEGEEAYSAFRDYPGRIHMLITDVVMPKMGGAELHWRLQEDFPDLKVIYMSGYTEDDIVQQGILQEGLNFLQKPLDLKTLAFTVRRVLNE